MIIDLNHSAILAIGSLSNYYELILLTILFTPILILILNKLCRKFNFLDFPNKRKSHSTPMPISGGLTISIILMLNLLYCFIKLNYQIIDFYINVYVFSLFFLAFGFIDDLKTFNTKIKVFLLIFLIFCIVFFDPNLLINKLRFYYIFQKTFILDVFSIPFTIFCIFMLFSALNYADGKNGIAISVSIFWLIYLLYKFDTNILFIFLALLVLLILLLFNLNNKLFLGNSGVNFISIFISLLIIKSYNTQNINLYCDEIFLLLYIPGLDAARVTITRALNKRSPFSPDRTHLHHHLEKIFNTKFIWLIYIFLCVLPIFLLIVLENFFISIVISSLLYLMLLFYKKFQKIFKPIGNK